MESRFSRLDKQRGGPGQGPRFACGQDETDLDLRLCRGSHIEQLGQMMVHDTKDDGRRNHANPRERGGGVESRSGERGAKDVVVEAAIVREKARALLVHLLLLGKAHHPRLAHGIEDDIRRQLLDRLRVELRDRGADGGGQGTAGLIIGKRQLADVLAVDPPRYEAVPLTEVHELRPPRNVVLHRLIEIRLELIHVVVVVVAIAVIVDQGLRTGAETAYMWLVGGSAGGSIASGAHLATNASVVPLASGAPPSESIHDLPGRDLVAVVHDITAATVRGGRGRRRTLRRRLSHLRADASRCLGDVNRLLGFLWFGAHIGWLSDARLAGAHRRHSRRACHDGEARGRAESGEEEYGRHRCRHQSAAPLRPCLVAWGLSGHLPVWVSWFQ